MGVQIFINDEEIEKRIVFLKDGGLDEFFVSRKDDESMVGNIFKGIVVNVLPGIQAAFVNIGLEKNGFLHFSDVTDASASYEDVLDEDIDVENGVHAKPYVKKSIQDFLKVGAEIIVQVLKNPIGTKGVRLTTNISLPGRYGVLLPNDPRCGVSRRIESIDERRRLKDILKSIKLPEGVGFIIRTVGEGKDRKVFLRDIKYLSSQWKRISKFIRSRRTKPPVCVYTDLDIVLKTIRDDYKEEVEKIVVDNKYEFKRIKRFMSLVLMNHKTTLEYYTAREPLFHHFGIEEEIKKVFNRKVWMKSGGYLVFDQTEALIAVDVNSGRNVGKNDYEETILQINLEAAEETAKQLKLRNVGGIVVIDFIDMKSRSHREAVINKLKEYLKKDRAKNNVLSVSRIGLVEMTRQRVQESTRRAFYEDCPCCHGSGSIKSATSISLDIFRAIKDELSKNRAVKFIEIVMHPLIADKVMKEERSILNKLPRNVYENIRTRMDINIPLDEYQMKIF